MWLRLQQILKKGSSDRLAPLPQALELIGHTIPQGTWALRNAHFYIKQGHPVQEQPLKFKRVVEHFHLGLFERLWDLSQQDQHKVALVMHTELEVHDDLKFFGGFKFETEWVYDTQDSLALGILRLNPLTYQAYSEKNKAHLKGLSWKGKSQAETSLPIFQLKKEKKLTLMSGRA